MSENVFFFARMLGVSKEGYVRKDQEKGCQAVMLVGGVKKGFVSQQKRS